MDSSDLGIAEFEIGESGLAGSILAQMNLNSLGLSCIPEYMVRIQVREATNLDKPDRHSYYLACSPREVE